MSAVAVTVLILILSFCNTACTDCVTPLGFQHCTPDEFNPCKQPGFEFYNKFDYEICLMVIRSRRETAMYSRTLCKHYGGNLIAILNERIQRTIEELASPDRFFWISLEYNGQYDDYRWNQHVHTELAYHNFLNGTRTPNEVDGDCVKLDLYTHFWSPAECLSSFTPICESYEYKSHPNRTPSLKVESEKAFPPKTPITVFVGDPLRATCDGIVGHIGAISWHYTVGKKTILILDNDTSVQNIYEFRLGGGVCQRVLRSCLTLEVAHNESDNSQTKSITCAFYLKGDDPPVCDTYGSRQCRKPTIFETEYSNREPWLLLNYHDKVRELFHWGRIAVFQCEACVGIRGNVSYETSISNNTNNVENCGHKEAFVSYTEETAPCGVNVTASLSFPVTEDTSACTMRCSSFMSRGGFHFNEQYTGWITFKTEYGPQTPSLVVDYSGRNGVVSLGSNITANCTACVGSEGEITWRILDYKNTTLTEEELHGLNITVQNRSKLNEPYCGKEVVSVLTLTVTEAMDNARLVCLSYNETYLVGVDVSATSVTFYIEDTSPGDGPNYFVDIFVALMFLLFLLLILLAIRYHMDRTEERKRLLALQMKQELPVDAARARWKALRDEKPIRDSVVRKPGEDSRDRVVQILLQERGQNREHRKRAMSSTTKPSSFRVSQLGQRKPSTRTSREGKNSKETKRKPKVHTFLKPWGRLEKSVVKHPKGHQLKREAIGQGRQSFSEVATRLKENMDTGKSQARSSGGKRASYANGWAGGIVQRIRSKHTDVSKGDSDVAVQRLKGGSSKQTVLTAFSGGTRSSIAKTISSLNSSV